MKTLKRKLLLSLSLPVDFFARSEGFKYQPYSFIYFLLSDYQRGSIRDAAQQLVRSGEADKIIRNHVPYFRLTGAGRDRLLSFFPIAFGQSRVWDRRWKIVIFSGKLISRRVKRKFKDLGFKRLARGVYLTPMPISERLKEYLLAENLLNKVTVIESRRLLAADDKNLAKKVWFLEEILENYHDFIKSCQSLLKEVNVKKGFRKEGEKKVVVLFNEYFRLLSDDPGLPKKVLPVDWPADLARETFLSLFEREKLIEPF